MFLPISNLSYIKGLLSLYVLLSSDLTEIERGYLKSEQMYLLYMHMYICL